MWLVTTLMYSAVLDSGRNQRDFERLDKNETLGLWMPQESGSAPSWSLYEAIQCHHNSVLAPCFPRRHRVQGWLREHIRMTLHLLH